MILKMNSNQKKWPNNWGYHISQYCNLYFYDKDIEYIDKNFWESEVSKKDLTTTSHMNLSFRIQSHEYMVGIHQGKCDCFSCTVFYRKSFEEGEGPIDIFIIQSGTRYICVLEEISCMDGRDISVCEMMDFAEESILEDYQKRIRGNWDDDNYDGENDPFEPFSPTGQVEPETSIM